MPDARECAAMTTTSECVELYQLFTHSGLTPDEAAELVDGIVQLLREQKEVLSKKLLAQQKAWADSVNHGPEPESAQANLHKASIVVGRKDGNALLDELPAGPAVLAPNAMR